MKNLVNRRLNVDKIGNFGNQYIENQHIENQRIDNRDKQLAIEDICQKCFKYQPILNNIYCIGCLQCDTCGTILSIKDEDCPHCSKPTTIPKTINIIETGTNPDNWIDKYYTLPKNPYIDAPVSDFLKKECFYGGSSQPFLNICNDKMVGLTKVIYKNNIPKCVLRYLIMTHFDIESIKSIILAIGPMNILDHFCKRMLECAFKGLLWNCSKGYLDIVKWLYLHHHIRPDIHEKAFSVACENGQLDTAKWLYLLGGIDIQAHEHAFSQACQNGHLDVIKWFDYIQRNQKN